MQLFWGSKEGGEKIILEGEEVTHLNKSLRKKAGDLIHVIDGSGSVFNCEILQMTRSEAVAQILEEKRTEKKWSGTLHIGIALTKNIDRIEWFVEKAVEMGIDRISFLNCSRSVKTKIRMDRIHRIVQSSMKQSLNCYLPVVQDNVYFDNIVVNSDPNNIRLIPNCEEMEKLSLNKLIQSDRDTLILIGPEGDISPEEISLALSNGFLAASMGDTRLRTETAGMMAVAVFQSNNWGGNKH
ncbi:MAG: RsmE family RNA methyltransferase [Saprospiraceae bacterium]